LILSRLYPEDIMQKPISPTVHGILDYSTMAAAAAAPRLLGMPGRAARTTYALAGTYSALSALTDYRPAVRRTVPLRVHEAVDIGLGLMLPMLPWLLGVSRHRRTRNFFLGLTAVTIAVTALTDWKPVRRRWRD
jgi:hypothetical protein